MPSAYTNAEILAAWLIHATQVGADGRLIPTDSEIEKILETKPAHFAEAHAIGTAFVKRVVDTEPRSVVDATIGFVREVNRVQEKLGGFLSAAPMPARVLGKGSR